MMDPDPTSTFLWPVNKTILSNIGGEDVLNSY
jgi:hypothetical protein